MRRRSEKRMIRIHAPDDKDAESRSRRCAGVMFDGPHSSFIP